MNEDIAIKVEHVSKTFKLPHEKVSSIKSAVVNFAGHKRTYEKQHVLNDISFEIKKGEFFGIVGRNGSGKSTLLKLLAGIYTPDKGHVQVNGKLTPFIELGVGFNHELTGRENVFLNGALLGFNRKEMEALYDDIVAFAELERFMDQKLKNYSSGMQVRLAFSIAIQARSDILILDEVLAVGDEAFQQKCIDVFENYKANNQTVVLVTHDMGTVKRFCTKAMLLNKGEILEIGSPNSIARKYSELNIKNLDVVSSENTSLNISLSDHAGKTCNRFATGDKMIIEIEWPKKIGDVKNVGIAVMKNSGEYIHGANTLGKNIIPKDATKVRYAVNLSLGPGKYHITAGVFGETRNDIIDFIEKGPEFIVAEAEEINEEGLTRLGYKWL